MISRTTAEQALRAAVRTGGDFAEIFLEDTKSSVLSLSQRKIEDAVIRRIHGAGIRVYRGLTSVYVHTNDTSPSGLTAAAERPARRWRAQIRTERRQTSTWLALCRQTCIPSGKCPWTSPVRGARAF